MGELMRDILAYHIPSMAHVLESCNPNNACHLNGFDKNTEPNHLCCLKVLQWKQNNDWREYQKKLEESNSVADYTPES